MYQFIKSKTTRNDEDTILIECVRSGADPWEICVSDPLEKSKFLITIYGYNTTIVVEC